MVWAPNGPPGDGREAKNAWQPAQMEGEQEPESILGRVVPGMQGADDQTKERSQIAPDEDERVYACRV
eukprot:scaffold27367_cov112-Isochrysis_galbana.AAC.10